jgi:hypothetical protein
MEREQMGAAFIIGGLNWETPLTFSEYYKEIYGDHSVDDNEMIDHNGEVNKMVGGKDESNH